MSDSEEEDAARAARASRIERAICTTGVVVRREHTPHGDLDFFRLNQLNAMNLKDCIGVDRDIAEKRARNFWFRMAVQKYFKDLKKYDALQYSTTSPDREGGNAVVWITMRGFADLVFKFGVEYPNEYTAAAVDEKLAFLGGDAAFIEEARENRNNDAQLNQAARQAIEHKRRADAAAAETPHDNAIQGEGGAPGLQLQEELPAWEDAPIQPPPGMVLLNTLNQRMADMAANSAQMLQLLAAQGAATAMVNAAIAPLVANSAQMLQLLATQAQEARDREARRLQEREDKAEARRAQEKKEAEEKEKKEADEKARRLQEREDKAEARRVQEKKEEEARRVQERTDALWLEQSKALARLLERDPVGAPPPPPPQPERVFLRAQTARPNYYGGGGGGGAAAVAAAAPLQGPTAQYTALMRHVARRVEAFLNEDPRGTTTTEAGWTNPLIPAAFVKEELDRAPKHADDAALAGRLKVQSFIRLREMFARMGVKDDAVDTRRGENNRDRLVFHRVNALTVFQSFLRGDAHAAAAAAASDAAEAPRPAAAAAAAEDAAAASVDAAAAASGEANSQPAMDAADVAASVDADPQPAVAQPQPSPSQPWAPFEQPQPWAPFELSSPYQPPQSFAPTQQPSFPPGSFVFKSAAFAAPAKSAPKPPQAAAPAKGGSKRKCEHNREKKDYAECGGRGMCPVHEGTRARDCKHCKTNKSDKDGAAGAEGGGSV